MRLVRDRTDPPGFPISALLLGFRSILIDPDRDERSGGLALARANKYSHGHGSGTTAWNSDDLTAVVVLVSPGSRLRSPFEDDSASPSEVLLWLS